MRLSSTALDKNSPCPRNKCKSPASRRAARCHEHSGLPADGVRLRDALQLAQNRNTRTVLSCDEATRCSVPLETAVYVCCCETMSARSFLEWSCRYARRAAQLVQRVRVPNGAEQVEIVRYKSDASDWNPIIKLYILSCLKTTVNIKCSYLEHFKNKIFPMVLHPG